MSSTTYQIRHLSGHVPAVNFENATSACFAILGMKRPSEWDWFAAEQSQAAKDFSVFLDTKLAECRKEQESFFANLLKPATT